MRPPEPLELPEPKPLSDGELRRALESLGLSDKTVTLRGRFGPSAVTDMLDRVDEEKN